MTEEHTAELPDESINMLNLLIVIAAPIIILQLKRLDYQGRQLERLVIEQKLYDTLKDLEFVDMKILMSHTVYTEPNTQHPKT